MNESTTTQTEGKRLPRFETRSRSDFTSAIPPTLATTMGDDPTLAKHRDLVQHFERKREEAATIAKKLAEVRKEDEERRVGALTAGKTPRPPRADAIEKELETARNDVALLTGVVKEAAHSLLLPASLIFLPRSKRASARRRRRSRRSASSSISSQSSSKIWSKSAASAAGLLSSAAPESSTRTRRPRAPERFPPSARGSRERERDWTRIARRRPRTSREASGWMRCRSGCRRERESSAKDGVRRPRGRVADGGRAMSGRVSAA